MRDYGVVYTKFWTEPDVQDMSDGAQMLALYLLTGPHTTSAGCFRCPLAYIATDRKTTTETVAKRFEELSRNGFAYRCSNTDWVIIPKFLQYNPIANPNCGTAVAKSLECIPKTFTHFDKLISMLKPFANHFPNGFINGLPNGMPNQDQDQDQEQEQEKTAPTEQVAPSASHSEPTPCPDDPVVCLLPLNDKTDFPVLASLADRLQESYPAVDVRAELLVIRAWCETNPAKRKTRRGIMAFVNRWLGKEQDRGGGLRASPVRRDSMSSWVPPEERNKGQVQ